MKKDPHYGQHINPISRLIQVMQGRKEDEPAFRLVGERGQNRYREFVVEVICGDMTLTGVGPNKKLAKRAAAVAMLEQIGYIKPMPSPGKSLLKKRSSGRCRRNNQTNFYVLDRLYANTSRNRCFWSKWTGVGFAPGHSSILPGSYIYWFASNPNICWFQYGDIRLCR